MKRGGSNKHSIKFPQGWVEENKINQNHNSFPNFIQLREKGNIYKQRQENQIEEGGEKASLS